MNKIGLVEVVIAGMIFAPQVWAQSAAPDQSATQTPAQIVPPGGQIASVAPTSLATPVTPAPVQLIQDAQDAPQLVLVPAGTFAMGSPESEPGRDIFEGPQHQVTIVHAFALATTPVTFEQWDACVAGGGCNGYRPDDNGWGRGTQPVINVSWNDAQNYVVWLRAHTGKPYRLPSEAEWEYAARAGATTAYWWGDAADHDHANYGNDSCCSGAIVGTDRWFGTAPVGSFPANPFGLYDMNGNVMEFTADCWHPDYSGAPVDGSAWNDDERCGMRAVRGGAWNSTPSFIRASDRIWILTAMRNNIMGFRVARDVQP